MRHPWVFLLLSFHLLSSFGFGLHRPLSTPYRAVGKKNPTVAKRTNNDGFALKQYRQHFDNLAGAKTFGTNAQSVVKFVRGGAAMAAATAVPPPIKAWFGTALLCALSYALYNIFIKRSSNGIDPLVGGVLLQLVAASLGALLLITKQVFWKSNSASIRTTRAGVWWAVAAGVAVGLAEILSFIISSMGVQASQSIPIIIGGSVLFGTVLGALWLGEALTLKGWCGVILIAAGIALVGLDSSGSIH